MWLQIRMYLLLGVMFGIIYAAVVFIFPPQNFIFYGIIASFFLILQYIIGPYMVKMAMGIREVSPSEAPALHMMVEELSRQAGIKKPKIGISNKPIPNAFAYGNFISGGHVCVTEQITRLLTHEELRAVMGHEISHLKNRDVAVITALSVIPMIMYYIALSTMFGRGNDRDRGNQVLIGIAAFILYLLTNILVLYGSRIREYYADKGSVKLGNSPHYLASALYKLVYGAARAPSDSLKSMEGYKAFFLNDPSRAKHEFTDLKMVDADLSGTIDPRELESIRGQKIKISTGDRLMELMSTHPNMLKRIQHLSTLTPYQG